MIARTEEVEDVLVRLRRIEGQVRGLQRMIEEQRSCEDVITQVIAVRAALDKVGVLALQNHIDDCVSGSPQEARERLQRATELLLKLSR
jgi:DNA-binding FrmR family transcriptional regulator